MLLLNCDMVVSKRLSEFALKHQPEYTIPARLLSVTSEFAGQVLRVSSGGGIFLDVVWLTTILRPILSHKLADKIFKHPHLSKLRDELVHDGVLRLKLAEHLWRCEMRQGRVELCDEPSGELSDEVVDALCGVIFKLGVALPLDPERAVPGDCSSSGDGASSTVCGAAGRHDMLVIMRLPETCTPQQQRELDTLLAGARQRQGTREVVLKWMFDKAGSPTGLVERLIASCYVVGKIDRGLCWRHGAAFKSHAMAAVRDGERSFRSCSVARTVVSPL